MLAIVDDDQGRPVRDEDVQRFGDRPARFFLDAERRLPPREPTRLWIRNRRQVHEPGAIG